MCLDFANSNLTCKLLQRTFLVISRAMETKIQEDQISFFEKLEFFRKLHNKLCIITSHLDGLLKIHMGASFLLSVTLLILVLFNIIWMKDLRNDPPILCMHIFWGAALTILLGVELISSAMVNTAVSFTFVQQQKRTMS